MTSRNISAIARWRRGDIDGPLEFAAHVLTSGMVGESHGTHHLAEFYAEEAAAAT
jgi:hypothetical protein